VSEHRRVEVDTAEPLDSFWLAEDLEPVPGMPKHRRVERAATQVVHGQCGTPVDSFLLGVRDSRGDRFGGVLDRLFDAGQLHRLA